MDKKRLAASGPLYKQLKEMMFIFLEAQLFDIHSYDLKRCNQISKKLADSIRNQAKEKLPKHYKVVSFVVIGETKNARAAVISKSVWEPSSDLRAEVSYANDYLYAVAVLYGTSHEKFALQEG